MKHVAKIKDSIVYSIRLAPDAYVLLDDEREITEEQFNTIELPATFDSDGNLVHSDTWVETPSVVTTGPAVEPKPTTQERVTALEEENALLKAQVAAQSDQMDFYEECIVEMAAVIYA